MKGLLEKGVRLFPTKIKPFLYWRGLDKTPHIKNTAKKRRSNMKVPWKFQGPNLPKATFPQEIACLRGIIQDE